MKSISYTWHLSAPFIIAGAAALVLSAGIWGLSRFLDSTSDYSTLLQVYTTTNVIREQRIAKLSVDKEAAMAHNVELQTELQNEQLRNESFGAQISTLASTVGILDKLSKTDKELLQKYSAVYFLNENFTPSRLADIDAAYLLHPDKPLQIHADVKRYLENLLRDANQSGVSLLVLSAYRSFGTQESLKTSYKIRYGAGTANSFSADQGYSEHQLGSAVDFTSKTAGETLGGFEKTPGSAWLIAHAYEYGFVLSYPKGNKYFTYEPWHWRFVGLELAKKLHDEQKYFYDLDQREINTYLVKIFD